MMVSPRPTLRNELRTCSKRPDAVSKDYCRMVAAVGIDSDTPNRFCGGNGTRSVPTTLSLAGKLDSCGGCCASIVGANYATLFTLSVDCSAWLLWRLPGCDEPCQAIAQ